ncbi:DUF3592 domain-containing protein [Kitasatospora sp. NPDC087315]|uniref:DUF3592 domain-containing protein n=1 Tax=Kitasatospora sp. NPDC087315 TaxID=3364069 RepID=UPI00381DB5FA
MPDSRPPRDSMSTEEWTEAPPPRAPRGGWPKLLGLLIGPAFLLVGIVFSAGHWTVWQHFSGTSRVSAVVDEVRYGRPEQRTDATEVLVTVEPDGRRQPAVVDSPHSAPDRLSAGDAVTLLHDPRRPGHALFPAQLGWADALFPGLLFCATGLAATAAGTVATVRYVRGREG